MVTIKCAEQSLASFETCCLAEVFLPNITSKEEFLDVITLLYRVCKHSLTLPSHQPETEAIVHKNMRMGIGLTGVLQATDEQRSWMDAGYLHIRKFDKEYSEKHGMNISIKLTTVKPSGTLSLLPGVTPGVHPGYSHFMLRRIRIAANSPLLDVCRAHGYPIEYQRKFDGTEDYNTMVVTFPFSYPKGTKIAAEMTALTQLEEVRKLQRDWSDNSVSCTVYYKKEEIPAIREYLQKYYKDNHKSLSFLLHSDHGFDQAPFEEITEEAFNDLISKTTIITSIGNNTLELDADSECAGGACPIR